MIVSIIDRGAGSSALSARPALPAAVSTSGMPEMARPCARNTRSTSPMEAWGIREGMNRKLPSSSWGMNSLWIPGKFASRRRVSSPDTGSTER